MRPALLDEKQRSGPTHAAVKEERSGERSGRRRRRGGAATCELKSRGEADVVVVRQWRVCECQARRASEVDEAAGVARGVTARRKAAEGRGESARGCVRMKGGSRSGKKKGERKGEALKKVRARVRGINAGEAKGKSKERRAEGQRSQVRVGMERK